MALCWFCEKEQADPEAVLKIGFKKAVGEEYKTSLGWEQKYITKEIPVPRCKTCLSRTSKSTGRNMIAGILFIGLTIAGFLIRIAFDELGTFLTYALPCSGILLGVIVGAIVAVSGGDVTDIKVTKTALEYPTVKQMIENNEWIIDEHWQ